MLNKRKNKDHRARVRNSREITLIRNGVVGVWTKTVSGKHGTMVSGVIAIIASKSFLMVTATISTSVIVVSATYWGTCCRCGHYNSLDDLDERELKSPDEYGRTVERERV